MQTLEQQENEKIDGKQAGTTQMYLDTSQETETRIVHDYNFFNDFFGAGLKCSATPSFKKTTRLGRMG